AAGQRPPDVRARAPLLPRRGAGSGRAADRVHLPLPALPGPAAGRPAGGGAAAHQGFHLQPSGAAHHLVGEGPSPGPGEGRNLYRSSGCRSTVNSARPSMSRRRTVSTSVPPSILTSPKNWKPSAGDVFGAGGVAMNRTSGPNVPSSTLGPNAPAFSGPD